VQSEDVICRFEFRDGDEADLGALVVYLLEGSKCGGAMDGVYLLATFARGIDARCYARDILCELLRALGIYLHVFGHYRCRVVVQFARCSLTTRSDEDVTSAFSKLSPLATRVVPVSVPAITRSIALTLALYNRRRIWM
jgi:hypothetical protein